MSARSNTDPGNTYIGRFAPSPSGPLHLGSLIAAVASYLDARARNGRWLLRIEDIDRPREIAGASETIIDNLRCHGLHWDGDIVYQSARIEHYQMALERLLATGSAFPCPCSRAQLRAADGLHKGECLAPREDGDDTAIRLLAPAEHIGFDDALQGRFEQQLQDEVGDFVLLRRDGCFAYQLAVVVDDADQGITDVVRGSDLLDSTPRQIYLQHLLGLPTPRYLHIPVITHRDGHKLSKQTFAQGLDNSRACDNLRRALAFLRQPPPPRAGSPEALLRWATEHWQREYLPAVMHIAESATDQTS